MPHISDSVVVFNRDSCEKKSGPVASDHLIEGNPHHQTWNYYDDDSGQYHAGIWESSAGKWHAFAGRNEFCYILSGRVRLNDRDGNYLEFRTGDSFVIKPVFDGSWEVLEDTRKLYVIYKPEEAG